jgi:hypothetical protein
MPAPDEPVPDEWSWQVVASRPDYSERAVRGRFASVEEAEEAAERLRAEGYRDVQVEPIFRDDET